MLKLRKNTGYPEGTNGHFYRSIPCIDTLPENVVSHWETLCTGYLRVTIFLKKEELIKKGIGQRACACACKVFEMVP